MWPLGGAASIPCVIERSTFAGNAMQCNPMQCNAMQCNGRQKSNAQMWPMARLTNKKNQPSWIASAAGVA